MTAPNLLLFCKSFLVKLLGLEPFWILILAPMVLFPGRLIALGSLPYIIVLLGLFWPIRWLVCRRLLPSTPLNWSIWLILLWLPANFWAAVDKNLAWQSTGYLVLGIAIFVALVDWRLARQYPQLLAWSFLLITLGLAILGPLLLTTDMVGVAPFVAIQAKLHPLFARLGETINPNILAGSLALAIPVQAALTLRRDWTKNQWATIGMGVLCAGTGTVLLLTISRGADLAVMIALAILLLLRWPKLLYAMPFVVFAIALCVYWVGPLQILQELTFNSKIGGLDQRAEIWSRAFYALQDFTFTGIGIGNFSVVIPQLYPYFLIPTTTAIPHAHNLLLQIALDLGVPGLIAYLALLINVFAM